MLTNCTENNTSDLYNVLIQQPLFDLETEPCDTCDLHEECHQDALTVTFPDLFKMKCSNIISFLFMNQRSKLVKNLNCLN